MKHTEVFRERKDTIAAVCSAGRESRWKDETRVDPCGNWEMGAPGFIILFSLLLYSKFSKWGLFLKHILAHFFHFHNSSLPYFGSWVIRVTTWDLARPPVFNTLLKAINFQSWFVFYSEVVLLLLIPGNAKKCWLLALQALGSPAMGKIPKMSPKPLRIACKKSRGRFQPTSIDPPAFTWGPRLGCACWGKVWDGLKEPIWSK